MWRSRVACAGLAPPPFLIHDTGFGRRPPSVGGHGPEYDAAGDHRTRDTCEVGGQRRGERVPDAADLNRSEIDSQHVARGFRLALTRAPHIAELAKLGKAS